jgi:hypothetical protein
MSSIHTISLIFTFLQSAAASDASAKLKKKKKNKRQHQIPSSDSGTDDEADTKVS